MAPLERSCERISTSVDRAVSGASWRPETPEFRRPEHAPPPLLRRMVSAGRLGRKSGHGFYEYQRRH